MWATITWLILGGGVAIVVLLVHWFRSNTKTSLWALAGRVVLGCLSGVGVLIVLVVVAAIGGNASFTEGVVRGMSVVAGLAGAIVVFNGAFRWFVHARHEARERLAGILVTALALGSLAAGGFLFVRAFGKPPVNLSPPEIVGIPQVGNVLRATPGRWDPRREEPLDFEYEWRACRGGDCRYYGAEELNGKPREYPVEASDVGRRIVVTVTAYGNLWVDPVASRPTAIVKP